MKLIFLLTFCTIVLISLIGVIQYTSNVSSVTTEEGVSMRIFADINASVPGDGNC